MIYRGRLGILPTGWQVLLRSVVFAMRVLCLAGHNDDRITKYVWGCGVWAPGMVSFTCSFVGVFGLVIGR